MGETVLAVIEVDADDIAFCDRGDPWSCAVASAMRPLLAEEVTVHVDCCEVTLNRHGGDEEFLFGPSLVEQYRVDLPADVSDWIVDWDAEIEVYPMAFRLPLPAWAVVSESSRVED